jgi:hypothetical protein
MLLSSSGFVSELCSAYPVAPDRVLFTPLFLIRLATSLTTRLCNETTSSPRSRSVQGPERSSAALSVFCPHLLLLQSGPQRCSSSSALRMPGEIQRYQLTSITTARRSTQAAAEVATVLTRCGGDASGTLPLQALRRSLV